MTYVAPKPIATKTFTTYIVSEGSWGARDRGKHESTMELYEGEDAGHGSIEWEIPAIDEYADIGLTYEMIDGKRHLTDYDGVFSLPKEAIELLESAGIVVSEEFR